MRVQTSDAPDEIPSTSECYRRVNTQLSSRATIVLMHPYRNPKASDVYVAATIHPETLADWHHGGALP